MNHKFIEWVYNQTKSGLSLEQIQENFKRNELAIVMFCTGEK